MNGTFFVVKIPAFYLFYFAGPIRGFKYPKVAVVPHYITGRNQSLLDDMNNILILNFKLVSLNQISNVVLNKRFMCTRSKIPDLNNIARFTEFEFE